MSEAIGRVVDEFLGENPTEDQVRGLAATLAEVVGVKVDRSVALRREARLRRGSFCALSAILSRT